MITTASRQVARSAAHRGFATVDWSKPIFKSDPEMMSKIGQFRAWVANADAMAEKYSGPPSSIDFASAKDSVRAKDLIDNLDKFYASAEPQATPEEWSAEDKASKAQLIDEAKADREKMLDDISHYKENLALMKANRTTRDTTGEDVRALYPDIAKEVDDEIDNREWFKDVIDPCRSSLDPTKYREAMKERYPDQAEIIDQKFNDAFPSK
eukprot:CAMPEP_0195528560 /NCGR_PEP_ID=MMETSP0794_2-20130614/30737_1 /TAXON_ID=515487 /ORGANISM="Stephanopyxis turris, Strain CCMP 815" /LENGTH=209 /DNA_ID=CAMNT_0040659715 /DNA_START=42 /DNA_END=671 /DNA_ORIENTATION=+